MKTSLGMQAVLVAGIVLLMSMQFMPSSAQNPDFCWNRIMTCHQGAETPEEFQQVCCPVIQQIVSNEMPCFCSIKSSLNATDVNAISGLLNICNITSTFDTVCSGVTSPSPQQTPSAPPLSAPPLSAPSPGPNSSPSVTPSAPTPGSNLSPSGAPTTPVSGDQVPAAAPSLDPTPSLTPAPMMPPLGEEGPNPAPGLMTPPPGSAESPVAFGPGTNGNDTESSTPQPGAANKMEMAGSLCGLLVLSIYVLFK